MRLLSGEFPACLGLPIPREGCVAILIKFARGILRDIEKHEGNWRPGVYEHARAQN